MTPKRPIELVHIPRIWPAFAVSSGVALILWPVAAAVGHLKAFVIFAIVVFCVGVLAFVFSLRRRVGFVPMALPSPDSRIWFIRVGLGLCWGAVLFVVSLSR
jgi:hypothetical protein